MEIKIENVKAAFNTADESGKKLLLALFPELSSETAQKADKRPVTERIKTFEDACRELGEKHSLVQAYRQLLETATCEDYMRETFGADMVSYMKLRIICAALNEGWEPQFTEDEARWYPWFWLYTQDEINNMDEQEKQDRHLISTGDYITDYAGFAYANSNNTPSNTNTNIGSHLCFRMSERQRYKGATTLPLGRKFQVTRKVLVGTPVVWATERSE